MHKLSSSLAAALVIVAATACAPAENDADRTSEADRQQALRDSAFGSMVEPMDRARGIEQIRMDRKRELDEALERDQGR